MQKINSLFVLRKQAKARLMSIFKLFCNQLKIKGKIFNSISGDSQKMNFDQFLSFCLKFDLLKKVEKDKIISIYTEINSTGGHIDFESFVIIISRISQQIFGVGRFDDMLQYLCLVDHQQFQIQFKKLSTNPNKQPNLDYLAKAALSDFPQVGSITNLQQIINQQLHKIKMTQVKVNVRQIQQRKSDQIKLERFRQNHNLGRDLLTHKSYREIHILNKLNKQFPQAQQPKINLKNNSLKSFKKSNVNLYRKNNSDFKQY